MPLIDAPTLEATFRDILRREGLTEAKAADCARLFLETTLAGVQSHGVNRFPRFVEQLRAGEVKPEAEPQILLSLGALEQWDGRQGIGNLNAVKMIDRAMELARSHGIGLVAIRNTNHWMRGGTYGQRAAEAGFIALCWTNTIALMPPWGTREPRLGNNPLVVGVPGSPITLVDMAMSMFSNGALEKYRLADRSLPADGGYDRQGALSRNAAEIEATKRLLPAGLWKGSGLAVVLDMMAALLSGGLATVDISRDQPAEYNVSQVFLAIDAGRLGEPAEQSRHLARIRADLLSAAPVDEAHLPHLPGQQLEEIAQRQRQHGIDVNEGVWQRILALRA